MGTINETGCFIANEDCTGTVNVELLQGENVVGTASVEIVKPDSIYFNSDEISLDFEQESDLGLVVRYQKMCIRDSRIHCAVITTSVILPCFRKNY